MQTVVENVTVVDADSYDQQCVDSAIQQIFDNYPDAIAKDSRVFVKLNLVRDMTPDKAGTTHPAVVSAIVKALERYTTKIVVGDSSGGAYTAGYMHSVYDKCGITDAIKGTSAVLNNDFGYTTCAVDGRVSRKLDIIYSFVNADVVINVGKLKTHSFTGYTGVVKNLYGLLPGLVKVEYHSKFPHLSTFCDLLMDIEKFAHDKIVLNIIDAIVGMEGAGPTNGTPRHIGKLIACPDAYKCDVVAVSLFNDPLRMPLLRKAVERAIVSEQFVADAVQAMKPFYIEDYKRVDVIDDGVFLKMPNWLGKLMKRNLTPNVTIQSNCRACAKCKNHCPASAITIVNKRAVVDSNKCIRCFCCQELCPFDAIKLKKPLLYRITRSLSHSKKH